MVTTITTVEAINLLLDQTDWTVPACKAVVAYHEDMEESSQHTIAFDVVDIHGRWTEYETVEEAFSTLEGDQGRPSTWEGILEYLEENTVVLLLDNEGIVMIDF